MKNRLMNNWGLKLLSIVSAVILWMVVVSVDNPVRTVTFSNIPVEIINGSAITSEGMVYTVLDNTDVITIEVEARRQTELSASDFHAVANMQDIQLMKYVPINITCSKPVESITTDTPNLRISIEDEEEKVLPIVVRAAGTPGDGYVVDRVNTIASPESVRISGAASAVQRVSQAVVEVDVSGLTMDTEKSGAIVFYNSDGDVLDDKTLSYNIDIHDIDVSVRLLKTKEVPIQVTTTGTVADGYRATQVNCEPSRITVAGDESALEALSSISLPAVSISNARANVEQVVDITEYLPENVQLVDEDATSVAVTVVVEQLETGTVALSKNRITMEGLSEEFTASFLTTTDVTLSVRSLREQMTELDPEDWSATVDLSGITETGTYELPLIINVPEGYELTEEARVAVRIEQAAGLSDTAE